ncbi:MAG: choice-of-anchor D domain-containing protein [Bradymonadaceae bacterium]|nr:choice-of-anchor D domain-containing protein [Lujinxingiaceae bacterium]
MKKTNAKALVALVALLALMATLYGCSEIASGCRDDGDCRTGRVCSAQLCIDPADLPLLDAGHEIPSDDATITDLGAHTDSGEPDAPGPDIAIIDDASPGQDVPSVEPDSGVGPADIGEPDVSTPLGPRLRVLPAVEILFGRIPVNHKVKADLLVENIGDQVLSVTHVDLGVRPSQGFDLLPVITSANPLRLQPGELKAFEVIFQPGAQSQFRNSARVHSDDPTNAAIVLDIRGQANNTQTIPCLTASPIGLNFGELREGETRELSVTVLNCGSTLSVAVTSIQINGGPTSPFKLLSGRATPFSLPPGQSETFKVAFTANQERAPRDVIEFRGDLTTNPRVVLAGATSQP